MYYVCDMLCTVHCSISDILSTVERKATEHTTDNPPPSKKVSAEWSPVGQFKVSFPSGRWFSGRQLGKGKRRARGEVFL